MFNHQQLIGLNLYNLLWNSEKYNIYKQAQNRRVGRSRNGTDAQTVAAQWQTQYAPPWPDAADICVTFAYFLTAFPVHAGDRYGNRHQSREFNSQPVRECLLWHARTRVSNDVIVIKISVWIKKLISCKTYLGFYIVFSKINQNMSFCNLFIKRPSYIHTHRQTDKSKTCICSRRPSCGQLEA